MSRSDSYSSSSSDSDGSSQDPFAIPPTDGFKIPSPVELSSDEEDASPSQYRKAQMASLRSNGSDNDATEDEDSDDQEIGDDREPESDKEHRPKSGPTQQMFSEFLNMSRKFTEFMEDTRKEHLINSRKSAKQSLAFDSPPPKQSKYRHEKFTPPRHARELISATQYDDDEEMERDSLSSSQTGSTRIRLQERWRVVGTKSKATVSPEEIKKWIEDHALAEMAKGGNYEDLRPVDTDIGGFKRSHVSVCILSSLISIVMSR